MKILILSDSHSKKVDLDLSIFDYVLHCGDRGTFKTTANTHFVRGNCDFSGPKELEINVNNKKFYLTHGDLYGVKAGYDRLIYKALEAKSDVVLFGHTHRVAFFEEENIVFINPGAYEDGFYIIIEDDTINFYMENNCFKKFEFKW